MSINVESIKNMFADAALDTVNLSELVIDAGTQQRSKMDKEAIENYAHAMESEQTTKRFPAIKVVRLTHEHPMKDGSTLGIGALVLVDGFHRTEAAIIAKQPTFQAFIIDGTLQDAIYYSMQANSQNGVNLKGKDYQNAIKNLYGLDSYWREHGRKKEIASLFGCSTKTVERACKAIDKEIKAQAFAMFEQGKTDKEIADFAFKDTKTIKRWREEWEATKGKQDEPKDNDGEPSGDTGSNDQQGDELDPMNMTFAQVLRLKNPILKAKLLKLLMDSIAADSDSQGTESEDEQPQAEDEKTAQDAAQDEDGAPWEDSEDLGESQEMQDLYNEWLNKDCWQILGKTRSELEAMANPKAALKRAYNKQLKRCHPDTKGTNRAIDLLTEAFSQAKKYFK